MTAEPLRDEAITIMLAGHVTNPQLSRRGRRGFNAEHLDGACIREPECASNPAVERYKSPQGHAARRKRGPEEAGVIVLVSEEAVPIIRVLRAPRASTSL